jgi:hypothetical protein
MVERDESRERLYRFRLDGNGEVSALEVTSRMPAIEQDPVLQAYTRVPSKENGVDIEGIAVRDGRLYVGFRLYFWDGRDCLPGQRRPDEPVGGSSGWGRLRPRERPRLRE